MTITKEQMDRIRRHLNGDKSEALGAWILDKNALNLALERIAKMETALKLIADPKSWGSDGSWDRGSYPDTIAVEALK